MSDFFAMGGYGGYVWGSFLVTALCMVIEIFQLRQRRRTIWRQLSRMK